MKIVLFGAGKSASVLIDFLLEKSAYYQWPVLVVDTNEQALQQKIGEHPFVKYSTQSVTDESHRAAIIQQTEVVISLLPPALHILVAKDCIQYKKHLFTASYMDDAMRALAPAIAEANVLFLAEMGLDPGIDHMSAKKLIDELQAQGAEITSFYSHCGGLIAPESSNNPWHYKISWNPQNIINAGKAGAVFQENGKTVTKSYKQLFSQLQTIETTAGTFGYYPNRDSLSYISLYGLHATQNFVRTTLRYPDFLEGWNALVQAGFTSDEPFPTVIAECTVAFFFEQLVPYQQWLSNLPAKVQTQIAYLFGQSCVLTNIATPAQALQQLLEFAWKLKPTDKDMVVMKHEIGFTLHGKMGYTSADLIVVGQNGVSTAMAATVGLPLGIAAEACILGKLNLVGLHIPTHPQIYAEVLQRLQQYGIVFTEETKWL